MLYNLLLPISLAYSGKFMYSYLNDESIKSKFKELNLENYKIKELNNRIYGHELIVEVINNGSLEEIKTYIGIFNKKFKCVTYIYDIEYTNNIKIDLVTSYKDLKYNRIILNQYKLLIGYNYKLEPVIVDMKVTPHIGVVGLSNSGKTKCVELMLRNLKGVNIDIINSLKDDFSGIRANKINGVDNIIDYFYYLIHDEKVYKIPRYVVIDEYNLLSHIKGVDDIISDLLRQSRHRNIFIILIAQQLQLEYCKFKELFNARLCFKQINNMSYYSFLGQTIDNIILKQREFILLHQNLEYGKTYLN